MPPDDAPILVEYAPPVSPVRRVARRWTLPILLALTAASAYWWAPPLAYRLRLAYWQDKCARHTYPPGHVVFEGDPGRARSLIAGGSHSTGGTNAAAYYVPPEWERFYALLSPPGFRSQGTAFLHALRTPSGGERLVAIDIQLVNGTDLKWRGRVFERGSVSRLPRELPTSSGGGIVWRDAPPSRERVLAGILDPADPSHFTFEVHTGPDDPEPTVFDGWLREDDGILVQARQRSTAADPISPPPPASPG
jgi:hypothetical protein